MADNSFFLGYLFKGIKLRTIFFIGIIAFIFSAFLVGSVDNYLVDKISPLR
jgi:hypothetical protein